MKLEHLTRLPGFACGVLGPSMISVWDATPTEEMARVAVDTLEAVATKEEHFVVLSVLGPNTPPPDSMVRQFIANAFAKRENQIWALAQVVEGEGFRVAALRAVLIGIAMLIRPPFPQKAFPTILEASEFLATHSEGRLKGSAIATATHQIRG